MSIQLGGVTFNIKVTAGRSATQVNRVAEALEKLKQSAAGVPDVQRLLNQGNRQAAESGNRAAQAADKQAGSNNRLNNSNRQLASSAQDLGNVIRGLAEAFGAIAISQFIRESTLLAARVENLDTVLRNTANTANFAGGEVSLYEDRIRALGITTQVTRTIMTRFAQNQLELADAASIARISQDAAVVAGINSSEATERMAVAIQRLDTRMLRNLGILVNLRQEYQQFGLQTGRVETSLTAAEKQQIVLNAVIREGAALAGNYEAALEDVFKRFTSLDRHIEEAARTFGENFVPALGVAVDSLTALAKVQQNTSATTRVFQSTLAGTVAGAASVAGILGLLRIAHIAYNASMASTTAASAANTAATNANTAALAANAAGTRAAATSLAAWRAGTTAATVSTATFTGALRALWATMLANPITATLLVVGAAVGGLVALISSAIAQRKRLQEEAMKADEERVAMETNIRRVGDRIEQLAGIENRSAVEQSKLNAAMREAVALQPELSDSFNRLSGDANGFLEVLKGQNFAAFARTNEDVIASLEGQADRVRQHIDLLRQHQEQTGFLNNALNARTGARGLDGRSLTDSFSFGTVNENTVASEIQRLEALEQRINNELFDRRDISSAQLLRELDEKDTAADTALQLAQRLAGRLDDAIVRSTGSGAVQAFAALEGYREGLSTTVESTEQINQRFNATLASLQNTLDRETAELSKTFEGEELTQKIAEAETKFNTGLNNARQKLDADFARQAESLKVFEDLAKLQDIELGKITDEIGTLTRELEAMGDEAEEGALPFIEKMNKLQDEGAAASEFFADRIADLTKKYDELTQSLKSATDAQADNIRKQRDAVGAAIENAQTLQGRSEQRNSLQQDIAAAREEQRLAEEQKRREEERERRREAAARALEQAVERRNQLVEDIRNTEESLEDEKKKLAEAFQSIEDAAEQHATALRDLTLQLRNDELSTDAFIAQQSGDEERAELIQAAQQFIGAAGRATNEDQLDEIVSLAEEQGLGEFIEDIRNAGDARLDQIDGSFDAIDEALDAQVAAAEEQIAESKKQTFLLEEQLRVQKGELRQANRDVTQAERNARRAGVRRGERNRITNQGRREQRAQRRDDRIERSSRRASARERERQGFGTSDPRRFGRDRGSSIPRSSSRSDSGGFGGFIRDGLGGAAFGSAGGLGPDRGSFRPTGRFSSGGGAEFLGASLDASPFPAGFDGTDFATGEASATGFADAARQLAADTQRSMSAIAAAHESAMGDLESVGTVTAETASQVAARQRAARAALTGMGLA